MKIYLVGGAVRDMLRGLEPKDLDYVLVGGDESDLRRQVPGLTRVGQGIPVFVRGEEQYTISDHADIMADLCSRDLTINALAMDRDKTVIAHPRALADLKSRVLRPVSAANFLADPLRVLRAARFAAALPDFAVHPDLILAMHMVSADLLGGVAAERVGQEMLKACQAGRPGDFLRVLRDGRGLAPWLAEFAAADQIPAGPPRYHDASVLEHTARVMDGCAGDPVAVWMALCHDLGKVLTPEAELPRHFGHEERGEEMAGRLSRRLRLSGRLLSAGRLAARWHMAGGSYESLKASTRVRLLLALDKAGVLDAFFRLVAADGGGCHRERARSELAVLKAVHLPEKHRNLGPKSAEILLQLRCEALVARGS